MNGHLRTTARLIGCLLVIYASSAQGVDLCDPGDVKRKIDSEKAGPAYTSCELEQLSATYFTASKELVDVLSLLKTTYLASATEEQDAADSELLATQYDQEIASARAASQGNNPVDTSTSNALKRLKSRVSLAHRRLQPPHNKIVNVDDRFRAER